MILAGVAILFDILDIQQFCDRILIRVLTRMILVTRRIHFFFLTDRATTDISPLPLPAALPICPGQRGRYRGCPETPARGSLPVSFPGPGTSQSRAQADPAHRSGQPWPCRSARDISATDLQIGRAHV